MKKTLIALMCALVAAMAFPLTGCGKSDDTTTRMTVEINPGVEFMLDGDNKVVSVTALNDDGSLIIAGEAFVGKTADDAVELMVSVSAETGCLIKGEASADSNGIRISVSGDAEAAAELYGSVKQAAEKAAEKFGLNAVVSQVQALGTEALREMLKACDPTLTDEQLENMSENEIIYRLRLERIECAELITQSLRDAYYAAKEYRIDLAGRDATKAVIEGLGDAYAAVKQAYSQALDSYGELINAVENARYEYFVSADSAYQQALDELYGKKAELQKQRSIVESMEDSAEKAAAELVLRAKEAAYETAEAAIKIAAGTADAAVSAAVTAMRAVETQLENLESAMPDEIKTALTDNAEAFDEAINSAKDGAFAKFEETFGDDIAAAKARLIERKEALIAAVSGQ